jgi:cbb3-type cytochrome oxidase subunit 3
VPRNQYAMNVIIIASIVLLLVAVGVYVFRAEKKRRRAHEQTRNPWDKL